MADAGQRDSKTRQAKDFRQRHGRKCEAETAHASLSRLDSTIIRTKRLSTGVRGIFGNSKSSNSVYRDLQRRLLSRKESCEVASEIACSLARIAGSAVKEPSRQLALTTPEWPKRAKTPLQRRVLCDRCCSSKQLSLVCSSCQSCKSYADSCSVSHTEAKTPTCFSSTIPFANIAELLKNSMPVDRITSTDAVRVIRENLLKVSKQPRALSFNPLFKKSDVTAGSQSPEEESNSQIDVACQIPSVSISPKFTSTVAIQEEVSAITMSNVDRTVPPLLTRSVTFGPGAVSDQKHVVPHEERPAVLPINQPTFNELFCSDSQQKENSAFTVGHISRAPSARPLERATLESIFSLKSRLKPADEILSCRIRDSSLHCEIGIRNRPAGLPFSPTASTSRGPAFLPVQRDVDSHHQRRLHEPHSYPNRDGFRDLVSGGAELLSLIDSIPLETLERDLLGKTEGSGMQTASVRPPAGSPSPPRKLYRMRMF